MDYSVPFLSMAGMGFTLIICVGLPLFLLIHLKKQAGASIKSFLIGCAVFVLFALVLESLFHSLVFTLFPGLAGNTWLYAAYGGLAAGIFEETGRYIAMGTVLKKSLNKQNALMYGAGHGGIEALLLAGLAAGSNLVYAIMVNAGSFAAQIATGDETVISTVSQMCSYDSGLFYMSGVERIIAIALHICLSYVVYRAVKDKRPMYYLLAVLIHAAIDAGTIIISQYVSTYALEAVLMAAVAVMAYIIVRIYRKEPAQTPPECAPTEAAE